MEILKTILGVVVALMAFGLTAISVIGWIQLLILAFRKNILWGIGSLFVWPVMVVFAIVNWNEAKQPVIKYVGGTAAVLLLIGASVGLTIAFTPPAERTSLIPQQLNLNNSAKDR